MMAQYNYTVFSNYRNTMNSYAIRRNKIAKYTAKLGLLAIYDPLYKWIKEARVKGIQRIVT